jgi:hypothetical protein
MMNEETRRRLTEYLGECWHNFGGPSNSFPNGTPFCLKCFQYIWLGAKHRTFTIPDGMDALRRKLVEKGDDRKFEEWALDKYLNYRADWKLCDPILTFVFWLMDPTRFCSLVGEYLERKEELNPLATGFISSDITKYEGERYSFSDGSKTVKGIFKKTVEEIVEEIINDPKS